MQLTDLPAKNTIPFANSADTSHKRAIPTPSQPVSGSDAPASFTDGFPPPTFIDPSAGGLPPNGEDFNGILNFITAWTRWQAAGGAILYDAAFATASGGYPNRAILASTTPGLYWRSTVDGNTTNPDSGGANWVAMQSDVPTGARGASGWRRSPDGFIEQWGVAAIPSGSNTTVFSITFPIPFVSEVHGPWGNADNHANSLWGPVTVMFPSTTLTGSGVLCDTANQSQTIGSGVNLRWHAHGY